MATLLITRGLPGSGKTTWARAWVEDAPARRVRVNRDDLRQCAFGLPILDLAGESAITVMEHARQWADLAVEAGAGFGWADFPTPLDVCLTRDAARDQPVGEQVIRGMYARFLASGDGFAPITATGRPGGIAEEDI
jgi:tRNA uridine 5-carbamoylmethylation protein Kti12